MGLKLVINISKKIPGPTDYSSVQASCSIEGELMVGQDAGPEAARLYAQAEAAVDRQLGIATTSPSTVVPSSGSSQPSREQTLPPPSRPTSYPSSGGRHRDADLLFPPSWLLRDQPIAEVA
jgi:hypothetical protein